MAIYSSKLGCMFPTGYYDRLLDKDYHFHPKIMVVKIAEHWLQLRRLLACLLRWPPSASIIVTSVLTDKIYRRTRATPAVRTSCGRLVASTAATTTVSAGPTGENRRHTV